MCLLGALAVGVVGALLEEALAVEVAYLAGDGVEVGRQGGNEGLALAGAHLADAALMENDAADDLDGEVLHPEHAPGGLAADGERLGQQAVQRLAAGVSGFELVGFLPKLVVREGGHGVLVKQHAVQQRTDAFEFFFAVILCQKFDQIHETSPDLS